MRNRESTLLTCILVGCFLTTSHATRAQQSPGDNSRDAPIEVGCQAIVTVAGAVRNPRCFEMRRRVRLLEALTLTGGPSEDAEKEVQIKHSTPSPECEWSAFGPALKMSEGVEIYNLADVLRGDEGSNPFLQPGDFVTVSAPPVVYVTGNVLRPQAVKLRGPLTVMQAIAQAGGVLPDSITKRVHIIRFSREDSTLQTKLTVDLTAIKKGRAEDVALQPYDVVEVPGKGDYPARLKTIKTECPLSIIY
jgi:protein involved in polysaccharide export with SLBB domain